METKIYVSLGTDFGNYGDVNIDICLTDLPPEWIKKSKKNGKKYILLTVSKKKEPDQYKKTHSVIVNTWKKEENSNDGPF